MLAMKDSFHKAVEKKTIWEKTKNQKRNLRMTIKNTENAGNRAQNVYQIEFISAYSVYKCLF